MIDPAPAMAAQRSEEFFSPSSTVTGDVQADLTIEDLSGFLRKDMRVIHMGEGRGYHGIDDYTDARIGLSAPSPAFSL
ncbi:MAG: hypothetical protein JW793_08335 [Acidobacteria bacterium]|nr:hypothetical protein [Acidobacteriota bacterium]